MSAARVDFYLERLGVDVTELAYLPDIEAGYVRSFRAQVVALPPGAVVLDRTFFYPTGGGQPADQGFIRSARLPDAPRVPVIDVTKRGPSVLHRVRGPSGALASLHVGAEVEGTVDWQRRHRHMRLHTAQHYLSARIFARTGRRTRRASLKDDGAWLDLDGVLSSEVRTGLEEDLADLARHPRPVAVHLVPRAQWANDSSSRSGLLPLPTDVDPVRVIEIEGVDRCPCGGTHVRSTREVGRVELLPPREGIADRVAFRLAAVPSAEPIPLG